jgi:stage V sporulation protein SpoVS
MAAARTPAEKKSERLVLRMAIERGYVTNKKGTALILGPKFRKFKIPGQR